MSYGFQNPFIDGKIWVPDTSEEVNFLLRTDPDVAAVGGNGLYVSSAELGLGLKENLELSLTLSPTYTEALRLIDESPFLRLGNTIYFRWGYNDGLEGHISDWYIGFMQMPEVSMGEEISIVLKGTGFAFNLNRVVTNRVWSTPETPRTFQSVAEEIGKKYGLTVVFDENISTSYQTDILTKYERTDLNQGGMTDLMFLNEKAKEVGVQMIIKNQEMIFRMIEQPPGVKQEVSHEFHMYGKIDTANNIFPMTGFTPESFGVLFLPHNQGYMSWVQRPNDDPEAEPVPLESSNKKDENVGDDNFFSGEEDLNTPNPDGNANEEGIKATVAPNKANMETGKNIPIAASNEFYAQNAESILDGARQCKASDVGIMVNFDSVGIPTFLPGMLCRLRGVSNYFSCDYMARRIDLSIEAGGASMGVQAGMKGFPAGLEFLAEKIKKFEEAISASPNEEEVAPDEGAAE